MQGCLRYAVLRRKSTSAGRIYCSVDLALCRRNKKFSAAATTIGDKKCSSSTRKAAMKGDITATVQRLQGSTMTARQHNGDNEARRSTVEARCSKQQERRSRRGSGGAAPSAWRRGGGDGELCSGGKLRRVWRGLLTVAAGPKKRTRRNAISCNCLASESAVRKKKDARSNGREAKSSFTQCVVRALR